MRFIVLLIILFILISFLRPTRNVKSYQPRDINHPNIQKALDLDTNPEPLFLHETFDDIKPTEDEYLYSKSESLLLDYASNHRQLVISGFLFCKMLDGSSFDTMVPIRDFGGSIAEINPDKNSFINMIDSKAYDIYQALMRKFHLGHQKEVKRISCYTAAEGQTVVANLTYHKLMTEVHPVNYFKEVLPAIVPEPSRLPGKRRKYKLAYLIMVHDKAGLNQLKMLLEILDDGDAIILIHVDARKQSQILHTSLTTWIDQRKSNRPHSSIFLAKYRFFNIWGHISLVYTQLSGFWELLDLAEWDYVINLSNFDWPIKRNNQIHDLLSNSMNQGKNFIEYWPDTCKNN